MPVIECNEQQLRLIQTALDFYSRCGILQLERLLEHDSLENLLRSQFRPQKQLEVGDDTERGEIVKITKKAIWTKGSWGKGEEVRKWTDIENIKLSIDYGAYREKERGINKLLSQVKTLISGETMTENMSYGIFNPKADDSCRDAFKMIEVIRHELWKLNPDRTDYTVDASVSSEAKDFIKVKI